MVNVVNVVLFGCGLRGAVLIRSWAAQYPKSKGTISRQKTGFKILFKFK
jgi:hypothetical protein